MRIATVAALAIAALAPAAAAESTGFHEDYLHEGRIELGAYLDVGNQVVIGYRRYFGEIVDGERPYKLQPFVQKATYVEDVLQLGPDIAWLYGIGGRYMFPDAPFGALAAAGFGKTDQNDDRSFADLGFDFYVTNRFPQFVIEARAEFGDATGKYNRLQAGLRALMAMPNGRHTLELYAGYGSLSTRGQGMVVEARYFFDKHLFAGLEFAADTDSFGMSSGYSTEKGFFAEMEFGIVPEGLEGWGDFLRISMGLQF